ncbi:hypothetical protein DN748_00635 [Sinomicrobium soli]|nr:hypothetical protein DN748_00635 [Sinomicrobium sp. N-1-3-6]
MNLVLKFQIPKYRHKSPPPGTTYIGQAEQISQIVIYPVPKSYNSPFPTAPYTIRVKIDTVYAGVAYAHNGKIAISSAWIRKKPGITCRALFLCSCSYFQEMIR